MLHCQLLTTCTQSSHSCAPCSPLLPFPHPPAGYRIFTADTDLATCSVNNPFAKCSTTQNKVLAIETDGSCAVRVFVLGDSQCSQVEDLAVVQG